MDFRKEFQEKIQRHHTNFQDLLRNRGAGFGATVFDATEEISEASVGRRR